jgi:RNA polymerase primary sigma factor
VGHAPFFDPPAGDSLARISDAPAPVFEMNFPSGDETSNARPAGPDQGEGIPDAIRSYLKQIGRVRLLTAEQEVDLAQRIEAGVWVEGMLDAPEAIDAERVVFLARRSHLGVGEENPTGAEVRDFCRRLVVDGRSARDELVQANLRLVVSVAKRHVGRGVLFLDLIQEGNLGLMRAADKFEYQRGFKFSTYAIWWIRQAVTRAIADQGRTIRLPVHVGEAMNRVMGTRRNLLQDLGREPSIGEIGDQMEMAPGKVSDILRFAQQPVSLAAAVGEDEAAELGDFIGDPEAVLPLDAATFVVLRQEIGSLLDTMSERERRIIQLRFGLVDGTPRTLGDVGREFGLTRERIRQIELRALAKLRHPSRSERLRDYLE